MMNTSHNRPHDRKPPRAFLWPLGLGLTLLVMMPNGFVASLQAQAPDPSTLPPPPQASSPTIPAEGDPEIVQTLVPILQKHNLPAAAAVWITSDGIQKIGVAGVRKRGSDVPATLKDLWHIGSNTKAMTATLTALLVEKGLLDWQTRVGEIMSQNEWAITIHPELESVNVTQLLTHRAGFPSNLPWHDILPAAPRRAQRREAARRALQTVPEFQPGSTAQYSNLGYVVLGAMLESKTGKSWEDLMRSMLFQPLGMSSAGFGGIGTPGRIDQPWGHLSGGSPIDLNGPTADNAPVLGPAGTVHCTLQDWSRFVLDQLRGFQGKEGLLSPESYQAIQSRYFEGEYSLGWLPLERDWAGGTAYNHTGSNTMYFSNAWIAPNRDLAILVCVNQGLDAFEATDEIVAQIIALDAASQTSQPDQPSSTVILP